jgi:hypothetical protein
MYVGGDGNDVVLTTVARPLLAIHPGLSGDTVDLQLDTRSGFFYTLETTDLLDPAPSAFR